MEKGRNETKKLYFTPREVQFYLVGKKIHSGNIKQYFFPYPLIKREGENTARLNLVCVNKRVRATRGQFVKSPVEDDKGPLHPSRLRLHLREGNLDGCYRNESEERPILRAINIKTNSAEK